MNPTTTVSVCKEKHKEDCDMLSNLGIPKAQKDESYCTCGWDKCDPMSIEAVIPMPGCPIHSPTETVDHEWRGNCPYGNPDCPKCNHIAEASKMVRLHKDQDWITLSDCCKNYCYLKWINDERLDYCSNCNKECTTSNWVKDFIPNPPTETGKAPIAHKFEWDGVTPRFPAKKRCWCGMKENSIFHKLTNPTETVSDYKNKEER